MPNTSDATAALAWSRPMTHVILIGDSVFDNGAYVAGGPDVVRQLRECLPAGWRATLRAVDGATSADIAGQLEQLPKDSTHLVLSVGGNDALRYVGVLKDTANSIAGAVARLADIADDFAQVYRAMVAIVLARRLPTVICTIYEPRFPDPRLQRFGVTALKLFNDLIVREAFARGVPLIDLRLICDRDEDYANPIEPSVKGGEKIAAAIHRVLAEHDFAAERTHVFVR